MARYEVKFRKPGAKSNTFVQVNAGNQSEAIDKVEKKFKNSTVSECRLLGR
jgi:hypothetical protein